MKWLLKLLAVLLGLGLAVVSSVVIWAIWPVNADQCGEDPAVSYLNAKRPDAPLLKDGYFTHNGATLHYVEAGSGDLVLFIHGFPSYWYSFSRQIDTFRSDYRVVAIDGLGAGRSDAPSDKDKYRLEAMSEHLLALIQHLEAETVHLVGHDWGAAFAFGFAQRYPDKVRSVTGISSPPLTTLLELLETDVRQQEISEYVERFKQVNSVVLAALQIPKRIWENPYQKHVQNGHLQKEESELFRTALSSSRRINAQLNWYRANLPSHQDIVPEDYWPTQDARLRVPALLIWGNDDAVFVQEFIELMRQSSDDLRVVQFDGVGHWPHLERDSEVSASIEAFIQASTSE